MLKASALFYVIVIAVLAAMLSGSLILSAYFNRLETSTYMMQERLQRNALSGIDYLLSSQEDIKADGVITDLFEEGEDSVRLSVKAWGAYGVALSTSQWHGENVKLAALTGTLMKDSERFALWLADQDRPLSLAGNTKIKGDAYLPKAGVQRAYIEGQSYSGDKLVYGNVHTSLRTIPALDKQLAERASQLLQMQFSATDSVVVMTNEDSITRSFFDDVLVVRSSSAIVLGEHVLSGQVVIVSAKKIVVKKGALLDNVLLAAPVIVIEDDFTGTLQAFARDTLSIGRKCALLYPSALGLVRTGRSPDNMLLTIGEETKVKGVVLSWQEGYDVRKSVLLSIGKKAEVTGQVYSSGLLDLQGTVNGSVIASRLLLRTPSSVYENHLLNAMIDITMLPPQFGGALAEKSNKIILKWMR